ncbi:lytic transglycosylase domain-containing protein [Trebonia kvetii]|uniref:aggregation-promoting factor C-terminal-like domain-containing protein n=1 Tax=Trebonia kvetii TaxID=2480626 RepID=UPI001FE9394D|nr:lytic transglycosylase domain-containing protein [Trebonia kvetii]
MLCLTATGTVAALGRASPASPIAAADVSYVHSQTNGRAARAAQAVLTSQIVIMRAAGRAAAARAAANAARAAAQRAVAERAAAERAARARAAAARAAAAREAARQAAAQAAAQRAAAEQAAAQPPAVQQVSVQQVPSGTPQQIAEQMLAEYGWAGQFSCLDSLWQQESGWNVYAENPSSGAYGIPQALPGGKMASAGSDWQTNPATQIRWGLGYIQGSYGSPCAAWGHEEAFGWY